jgi:hypothetical protein
VANELTATELSPLIPENWRPRFVEALYEKQYVLPYALNVTGDFSDHNGKGDIANIAIEPTLSTNDTSSDGSLTVQQVTTTNIALAVDKNKNTTVEIVGIAREQAFKEFETQFPISAGNALREKMESDLLALYSDATTTAAGDGTGNLGEDEFLAAVQQLVSAKVPIIQKPGDNFLAIADTQFQAVRKLNLMDYSRTGQSGHGGAAEMEIPKLWGIPVVFSTQVASSGGIRYSLLANKQALAWAAQRNVEPRMADRLAAAKDSWLMTVLALYGVKTVTAGRMVQLKSKA